MEEYAGLKTDLPSCEGVIRLLPFLAKIIRYFGGIPLPQKWLQNKLKLRKRREFHLNNINLENLICNYNILLMHQPNFAWKLDAFWVFTTVENWTQQHKINKKEKLNMNTVSQILYWKQTFDFVERMLLLISATGFVGIWCEKKSRATTIIRYVQCESKMPL